MRIKKYIFIVVLGIVFLIGAIYATGYFSSFRIKKIDVPAIAELVPDNTVSLGSNVTARFSFELPLHRNIEKVSFVSGKGTVAVGNVKVVSSYYWNKRKVEVSLLMRPFLPGTIEKGTVTLEFNGGKEKNKAEVFTVNIPSFQVKKTATNSKDLTLASAENLTQKWYQKNLKYIYIVGASLAVIVVLLILLLLKKEKKNIVVIPEWQQALNDVDDLRKKVADNFISSSVGFVILNDVVRRYLERRFLLPATKLTTEEFLYKLEKNDSLLPKDSKTFLRDFASLSDLVKFAKQETTTNMFNLAADSAVSLIDSTKVEEKEDDILVNKENKK